MHDDGAIVFAQTNTVLAVAGESNFRHFFDVRTVSRWYRLTYVYYLKKIVSLYCDE